MKDGLAKKGIILAAIGLFFGTGMITGLEGTHPSWVHILSPHEGETYEDNVVIIWTFSYPFDCYPCFDIYYKTEYGYWVLFGSTTVSSNEGSVSYTWVATASVPDGSYMIRVDMRHCGEAGTVVASDTSGWFFVGSNASPVACYSCSDFTPNINEMVTFDGSCSSDPDGHIVEYSWFYTVDGGVPVDMGNGKTVSYSWSTPGSYLVTLEVTDDNGASDQETKSIMVGSSSVDLDCSGSLLWTSVEPGGNVKGSFTVRNIGDAGSGLKWRVESYPSWGDWAFTPESGTGLTPGDGPVTVQVSVDAPNVEESSFSGQILVVNSDDGSDYETLSVSLSTPVNKFITNPLINYLNNLLQYPAHLFPLLRHILVLLE